jgi:hypothetical protein
MKWIIARGPTMRPPILEIFVAPNLQSPPTKNRNHLVPRPARDFIPLPSQPHISQKGFLSHSIRLHKRLPLAPPAIRTNKEHDEIVMETSPVIQISSRNKIRINSRS